MLWPRVKAVKQTKKNWISITGRIISLIMNKLAPLLVLCLGLDVIQGAAHSSLRTMDANLQKVLPLTSINHTMYSTCFSYTSSIPFGTTLDTRWKGSWPKEPSTYLLCTMLLILMWPTAFCCSYVCATLLYALFWYLLHTSSCMQKDHKHGYDMVYYSYILLYASTKKSLMSWCQEVCPRFTS